MKIAVIGGTGAMGSAFGACLTEGGNDVTLVDVARDTVDTINQAGVRISDKAGAERLVRVKAVTDTTGMPVMDLVIVFVKCYHTEAAIQSAASLIGDATTVLSLQNGWGNAVRLASVVGRDKVIVGVTYHSASIVAPGHVLHAGKGMTWIGELDGIPSERLDKVAATFRESGLEVTPTSTIVNEIWSKLSLNVCTLPTSAMLRFSAGELGRHDGTISLMRGLLAETAAVARAKGIELDEIERWNTIVTVLEKAGPAKSSMLQDVEKQRRTEIDVINGAIADAGRETGVATPINDAMIWLIKSMEDTFGKATA